MLLAAADSSDPDHTSCRELLETHSGPLVTTTLVMAESGWLIDRQLSAADWTRIAGLTIQYADQHLGGVDSSLVAIAERLALSTSPPSSCFRKSAARFHDCILPLAFTDRVPSGVDPAAPLQQSHDPDYPHPFLVTYMGGG